MISVYKYQVKDNSILTPPFKSYFLEPIGRRFPSWVPANFITIMASSCMLAAMIISIYSEVLQSAHFLMIALLIFAYLLGDLLDGFQAKRTQTSSPLGEFFDHFLDTFVNIFMLMTLFTSFRINNIYFISFSIMFSYLAQTAVFNEQQRTGWLIFEKFGVFEAFSFAIITYLVCAVSPLEEWLVGEVFSGISYAMLILGTMSTLAFFALIRSLFRSGGGGLWFVAFVLLLTIVTTGSLFLPLHSAGFYWMIAFYSIDYMSRLMHAHHGGGSVPKPDMILPLMIVAALSFPFLQSHMLVTVLVAYPLMRCLFNGLRIIYAFKSYWVWINPLTENKYPS